MKKKFNALVAKLKREATPLREERRRLSDLYDDVDRKVRIIEAKVAWLARHYRYGDIVESEYGYKRKLREYVIISSNGYGRILKKDGTLGKDTQFISSLHHWGRAKREVPKVVGQYTGADLPEPSEAQKFGMDNR